MTDPFSQPTQATGYGDIVGGRYYLPHPETMQPHKWTRTTNYISKIAETYAIEEWEKQMVIVGLTMREDLYIEACGTVKLEPNGDLSKDCKKDLNDIISRAKEVAGGNTGARLGTAFHSFTERAKRGEETRVPAKWVNKVELYLKTLADNKLTPQPHLLERRVVCLKYNLAGTFDDALLSVDLGLVVGDTKSQKDIYSYADPAMQLGVYAHADLMWNAELGQYEEMPPFNKETGLMLWVPVRGVGEVQDVCEVHELEIGRGWKMLEAVKTVHEWQKAGKRKGEIGRLYVPKTSISSAEAYAKRLREAASVDELSAIYQEASSRGLWSPELEDAGLIRKKSLDDLVSTVDTLSTVN